MARFRPSSLRAGLLIATTGLCLILVLFVLALQLPPVGTRIANAVLEQVVPIPRATTKAGAVQGNWLTRLELYDVRCARNDTMLAVIDTVRMDIRPWRLLMGELDFGVVAVQGIHVSKAMRSTLGESSRRSTWTDRGQRRFYRGPQIKVEHLTVERGTYASLVSNDTRGPRVSKLSLAVSDFEVGNRTAGVVESLTVDFTPSGDDRDASRLKLRATLSDRQFEIDSLWLQGPRSTVLGSARIPFVADSSDRVVKVALRAKPLELADLSWVYEAEQLSGQVVADVALKGERLDRLSGMVDVRFESANWGDAELTASRWVVEVAGGEAKVHGETVFEGAHARVGGTMRLLDAKPTFDLELEVEGLPGRLLETPALRRFAQSNACRTRLRLTDTDVHPSGLRFAGNMALGVGRVTMAGSMAWDHEFRWVVDRASIDDVDVAAWMGDTTASALRASLSAQGRGLSAESMRVAADWRASGAYGRWNIANAQGCATWDGQRLGASLRLDGDSSRIELDTLVAGFDGSSDFSVPEVRFRVSDLAALTGNDALQGRLAGTLSVEGRSLRRPETLEATGVLVLHDDSVQGADLRAARFEFGFANEALNIDGALEAHSGRMSFTATGRPFDVVPSWVVHEAELDDVDLSAWFEALVSTDIHARLSGRLEGPLTGVASFAGNGTPPRWSGELHLQPSRIGSLALVDGTITTKSSEGRAVARGTIGTRTGSIMFDGGAALGPGLDGHMSVILPIAAFGALGVKTGPEADGEVRLQAIWSGSDTRSWSLDAGVSGRGRLGSWTIDTLHAGARYDGRTVHVDTLSLLTNAVRAHASGQVAFSDDTDARSDFRLRATLQDLVHVRSLFEVDTLATHGGLIEARLTGRPAAHTLSVKSALRSLVWNDLRLLDVDGEVRAELGESWRPSNATARFEFDHLTSRVLNFDRASLEVDAAGGHMVSKLTATLGEGSGLSLAVDARRDSGNVKVRLRELKAEARGATWQLARPVGIEIGGGRLTLGALDLRGANGYARARGYLGRHGEQDFHVDVERMDLDMVGLWLGRPDLSGRMDARLAVTGSAASPQLVGALRVAVVSEGEPAGVAEARVEWDGLEARANGFFATPRGDSLTVFGTVPFEGASAGLAPRNAMRRAQSPDREIDVRFVGRRFPLAALKPFVPSGELTDLKGRLDADVRIHGRGSDLLGQGVVRIRNGLIGLARWGVTHRDVQLTATLSEDRLDLDASAKSGGGEMTTTGGVHFESRERLEPDVSVELHDYVLLASPDLALTTSGALQLAGTFDALELSGRLTLDQGGVNLSSIGLPDLQGEQGIVLTSQDVRMMEETFGHQAQPGPSRLLPIYRAADLDLHLAIGRGNWVRNHTAPRLAAELEGSVRIRKSPLGELKLDGRVRPVPGRGYVEHFGRSFDIVGGEALLSGGIDDHTVDLETEYKVRSPGGGGEPEVVVHLDLHADRDHIRAILSSEPTLTENQILSYITTGRDPTKPSGSEDKAGSDAAALAADIGLSQVTAGLESTVGHKISLDQLRVRYDAAHGATVVAGRYVGRDLYVGLQQPLQYRGKTSDSQRSFQTAVEVDYEAYRWLVINLQAEASLLRSFVRVQREY